ncbi:prolyl endopeptidase FAP isoform X1 [Nematostella vectensis]|uniref:prolyl endopeptidase FAP isoform X1 n=1 Tax=Nematostella vectensis TaxID=45351 RepID=UPI002076F576|nr:prolyl endopeptidase FAP isoform X1 [Nematostella vectensis]
MAEGNEHLLGEMDEQQRYSAMDMEDPKSPQSGDGLLPGEGKNSSSLKINKRALVIFFGVTVVAVAVIVVAVLVSLYSGGVTIPGSRSRRASGKFTLDDVFSGKYQPKFPSVKWLSDDTYRSFGPGGSIITTEAFSGAQTEVVSAKSLEALGGEGYTLSPDKTMLFFAKNKTMEYRYSSFADYFVYDIAKNKYEKIVTSGGVQIQHVRWAPDRNALVYVVENDMHYIDDVRLPLPEAHRLTNDGDRLRIFNGVPDWVYQEEVLNTDYAMYFSPDSKYLAYMQFNDTRVKDYVYPWYGSAKNIYPSQRKIAYPKPGTPNPTVRVKVIDLTRITKGLLPPAAELPVPAGFDKIEHYVVNVGWTTTNKFTVQWLNRFQNHSQTDICSVDAGGMNCIKGHEEQVKGGWVDDKYTTPLFTKDESAYVILYPFTQGENGAFIHLALVQLGLKDHSIRALTSGAWEVTKILGFDKENGIVYFESTETGPTQRHIYSFELASNTKKSLTKDLACNYFKADFSKDAGWCVLTCQGPDVPWTNLRNSKTGAARALENNDKLKKELQTLGHARTDFIKVRSGTNDINVKLVFPPNFDPSKKYAVLFSVYGGPGTQNVLEAWQLGYEAGYLVRNFDLIMAYVDARGTMGRGNKFKHAVYRDLGRNEAEDTIAVAKFLKSKSYVAKDKIAIWGWSYGGYLTSYIIGQNSGAFNLGMAVAPVADWRYYDSIYTERYMGLPKENSKGYEDSSVLPLIKNFKDVSYLIVHGTGDDNVHFQNSAQIVKKLTLEEIDYRVQYYPDRNHGITDYHAKHHLFKLLTRFLDTKLRLQSLNPARAAIPYPYWQYPGTG